MRRHFERRKRKIDANEYDEADVKELITAVRRYMPYYGFNVQRVDLDVR